MHPEQLLHRWLTEVFSGMHQRRREAVGAVISGALEGGKLTVTSLGRWMKGKAKEKHNIKRADRLLSNTHLQSEIFSIYSTVAHQVLGATKQPIILVDWTDVDARREFFILRAATPVRGRSITLYEEVHDRTTRERRSTHNAFIDNLKEVIPEWCQPIVVTDAGFRAPWFKKVASVGWEYVGRVRNREMVKLGENKEWNGAKSLYSQATNKAKLFSEVFLTRSNPVRCSLVLFKHKRKGRVSLGKMGKKKHNRTSLVNAARAKEPWLLGTSLRASAKEVVRIYSTRMQIEEAFRDLKCPRYGLSLYNNGTYKIERMKVLLLIGSLTATFAWLLGKAIKIAKQHRQYQANTVTHTNVLSINFIGIQAFRDWRTRLSITKLKNAITMLTSLVNEFAFE